MKYDIDSLEFRTLHADEIELRVGTVSAKGATLLLYQDARCAMNILDETVGRSNWQRSHKEVKGNLFCSIGIWDEEKSEWVWKEDCGTESNTEKEKGEASDSMKRAAVNWGIARELYTSPFIFIDVDTQKKQTGKGYELTNPYIFSGARVSDIEYDDKRRISALTIVDKDGVVMYSFPRGRKPAAKKPTPKKAEPAAPRVISVEDSEKLKDALMTTESDTAKFLAFVGKTVGRDIPSIDSMTYEEYDTAIAAINKKIEKGNK